MVDARINGSDGRTDMRACVGFGFGFVQGMLDNVVSVHKGL